MRVRVCAFCLGESECQMGRSRGFVLLLKSFRKSCYWEICADDPDLDRFRKGRRLGGSDRSSDLA